MYLDFKHHELKNSTLDKYINIVKNRINPFFENMLIDEIKASDVKRWLYSINDVGTKSKRHYIGVLSGIFHEALLDEVIQKNPVKYIRLPKYKAPCIKPFTTLEVFNIMHESPNNNFKYYLAIAFFTGMRSGEIIALKKSDIDLKNMIIHVRKSRNRFGETTPKTLSSIRDIPIISTLELYIKELYFLHDYDYLFVTQYHEPYRDTNVFVNDYWIPLLKKLNIEYRRPYNTRHTYATNMLYKNLVTPLQLAQLLGHVNAKMVYEVYVNYIDSNYKDFDRNIEIY